MKRKTRKRVQKAVTKEKKTDKEEGNLGRHALLKAFVFSAAFILIVLFLLPVRYEINDELALVVRPLNERAGVRPDLDSTRTFLISQTLHYILYYLYEYWPSIPWLGVFMYLVVFLGCSLMLALVLRANDWKYSLLAVPPLALLVGYCCSFVSVTAASLLLEFGVFMSLMEWTIRNRCPTRSTRWYGLFLMLCFCLSFLLRWRLVVYAIVFAVPILFFLKKDQLRKALPFVVVSIMIVVGDRALLYHTSTEEYKEYIKYNAIRGDFNDTIKGQYHGDMTLKALDEVGWSLDDYAFFRRWILYDEKLFNVDTITKFTKENDPAKKASIFELIRNRITMSFSRTKGWTFVLAFSVLSLLFYRLHRLVGLSRHESLRIVCSLVTLGAGVAFLMYYRFPERLFVPLYAYLLGTSFLIFRCADNRGEDRRNIPTLRRIALIPILILVSLTFVQIYKVGKTHFRILEASKREKGYIHECLRLAKKRSIHPDPLLVLMDPLSGLRPETVHPLKELSDFPDVRVFPGGSRTNSPAYFHALRRLGVEGGRAFLKWTVDNERVLLVILSRGRERHRMMQYLWRSYLSRRIVPGREARLIPAHDFRNRNGAGLVLYNVVTAD